MSFKKNTIFLSVGLAFYTLAIMFNYSANEALGFLVPVFVVVFVLQAVNTYLAKKVPWRFVLVIGGAPLVPLLVCLMVPQESGVYEAWVKQIGFDIAATAGGVLLGLWLSKVLDRPPQ